MGVPQVVKPDSRQLGISYEVSKCSAEAIGWDWPAIGLSAYKRLVLIIRAKECLVCILYFAMPDKGVNRHGGQYHDSAFVAFGFFESQSRLRLRQTPPYR